MNNIKIKKLLKSIDCNKIFYEYLKLNLGNKQLSNDNLEFDKIQKEFKAIYSKMLKVIPERSTNVVVYKNYAFFAIDCSDMELIERLTYIPKHNMESMIFNSLKLPAFYYLDDLSINEIMGCSLAETSINLYGIEKLIALIMNDILKYRIELSIFNTLHLANLTNKNNNENNYYKEPTLNRRLICDINNIIVENLQSLKLK